MVDIGGYSLHLALRGSSGPTVVMEAGFLDFSIVWDRVAPEVARFARVVTYDRAGLGWSDPSPRPRTSEVMVDELHELLQASHVEPPYLLVGHSFGTLNMRLFADRYSDEVTALVLVDPASEYMYEKAPEMLAAALDGAAQFKSLEPLRRLGLIALIRNTIPNRGFSEAGYAGYQAAIAARHYLRAAIGEINAAAMNYESLQQAALGSHTADIPVTIICRGLPDPLPGLSAEEIDRLETVWHGLLARTVACYPQSKRMTAERSSHNVHMQQPELVVGAIRDAALEIEEVRTALSLEISKTADQLP